MYISYNKIVTDWYQYMTDIYGKLIIGIFMIAKITKDVLLETVCLPVLLNEH